MKFHKPDRSKRVNLYLLMLTLLSMTPVAFSQNVSAIAGPPVAPADPATVQLTDTQLQTLLAPIALYPDALLAQILPASTYPLQVVTASRFLQANPNPPEAAIDAQNLEPSVKALLHYPTVLAMMNNQLDWTQSLGVAFLNQQADVMSTIQNLRQQARNAGVLQSTPQQQVITDDGTLQIIPVNPDQIYVPEYDPLTIYAGGLGVGLSFGVGYPEGLWLDNNVDWHHHWVGGGRGWNHGWDNPIGDPRSRNEPPLTRPWARNSAQPLPIRRPGAIQEGTRDVPRPGYETPKPSVPAPAFGGYQNRNTVERQETRAQQSRPAPVQQARPAPQQARPVQQAAPAQVFHAQGSGQAVAAQSARGNASRAASPGGGGGGGRRK